MADDTVVKVAGTINQMAGVRQVVDTLLANRLHNVRLVGMQCGHALHQQEQHQQTSRHALTICIPCFGQDFKTLIV